MDCDVCHKEESKSKTLTLNKTKILQKEIIPSNQCWHCNLTFEDGDAQVQHFLNEHEFLCPTCNALFETDLLLKKHVFDEHHHVCDLCGEVFLDEWQKDYHIREKHKADKVENGVPKLNEQTNLETTSDQNKGIPRTGQRNRKKCSLQ